MKEAEYRYYCAKAPPVKAVVIKVLDVFLTSATNGVKSFIFVLHLVYSRDIVVH